MPGGGERNYSVVRRPDGTYSQSSVWRMSLSEIQKRLRKS
jgi:hypothetical protein